LHREAKWAVALATGCWRDSAELKLKAAGIETEHFPAAFAEDGFSREEILGTAVSHAQQMYGQSRFDRIVSLGDAQWDVAAARNLGIAFIGIGKGERGDRLRQVGATHMLDSYINYRQLIAALEEAEVPTRQE
jgi:phosphoglycolate phosphatase-like HAD superfamily hydrolase